MGLLGSYLDTIDTAALSNLESGRTDQFEAPFLPLLAPWIVAAPVLYLFRDQRNVSLCLFVGAMILSVAGYALTMVYYLHAKRRHRESLGLPDWRKKMRQKCSG